ncbi:putative glycosyltransferase [unidentified eubacterium SCB49]|nr:putative glycosyltransferase [unidentified eubacterium SCB49]
MSKTVFIIGHTFPEPETTAAGSRMMQLINLFLLEGYKITFGSTASMSDQSADLVGLGVHTEILKLNHPSFDTFIAKLQPDVVLFDRFITEEQFGWRVAEQCPDALRVLDTEDLHFLRKAREAAYKKDGNLRQVDLFSNTAKREITSILKCDLSLIISEIEMELLITTFKISEEILQYLPFLPKSNAEIKSTFPKYEARRDFVTIGNFFHAPNVDSVKWLHKDIWPLIRAKLPKATLSVYGAYAPQQITELHNEKQGFFIKGWVPSVETVMSKARVCLAPIRFGAGLKGKLLDAMFYGTPAVTTSIGAEGMYGVGVHAGGVEDEVAQFVNRAVLLHEQEEDWLLSQQDGFTILNTRFNTDLHSQSLLRQIQHISETIKAHRASNFMGQILQQQSMQAAKYLSKWIALKNS